MKEIYFLKNFLFTKSTKNNPPGKRKYKRDIGYSVASLLQEKLNKKVKLTNNPDNANSENVIVINWGCSRGYNNYGNIFNNPQAIKNSVNKIKTLQILTHFGVPTLRYTTDKLEANHWRGDPGVIVRHIVDGHGGKGVEVITEEDIELPDAELYTLLYEKTDEVRVHVFNGEVIQIAQKKRMSDERFKELGYRKRDEYVRNHKNGWIISKNNLSSWTNDEKLRDIAINAISALGLTFGAVDILCRVARNQLIDCLVCETNTAPGIEGSTLDLYTNKMKEFLITKGI